MFFKSHTTNFLCYRSSMPHLFTTGFCILEVLAFVGAVYFGYQAAISSIGPEKGRARFRATTLVGVGICLLAISTTTDKCTHPLLAFDGTLLSQHIVQHDSRRFSDYLQIQTFQGGLISVHISSRIGLTPGQKLRVQYESESGEVRRVRFYSESGILQREWKSPWALQAGFMMLLGLFFIWGARLKFRRDPEDQEEPREQDSNVTTTVDEASLLHLHRSEE